MASGKTKDDAAPPTRRTRGGRTEAGTREDDVGTALRGVYQSTVSETVPQDLLDLLGKLG